MEELSQLNNLILKGDFEQSFDIIKNMKLQNLSSLLLPFIIENPSVMYYGFSTFLIQKQETAENHYLASIILCCIINTIEGAYNLAYYHALKCIELDPNDISYQEYILLFYSLPDRLLKQEQALLFAENIIKSNSENKQAAIRIANELKLTK